MSYLKNYRRLMLLLVSVSLILAPVFLYNEVLAVPSSVGIPGGPPVITPTCDDNGGTGGSSGALTANQVMISLSDLNDWINNGYNNGVPDAFGYQKMAILSVQTAGNYTAGHPTGAYLWDQATELRIDRSDGVLSIVRNVATQSMMDAVLQKAGIDADTVIVVTGNNLQMLGLGYFNLRYWGFPKKRLKVMNGLIKDYITAGFSWDTNTPAPAGGTYSVCNAEQCRFAVDEVRASLGEMLSVAADSNPNTIPLDVRSSSEFDGTQVRGDIAYQGRIRTAVWNEWKNQATNGASGIGTQIKDAASLTAIMNSVGITSADTVYTYCQTATRTGVTFLAVDAVLGWKIKKYDGSWVEWGNLTDDGGTLPQNSPWRTDCGVPGATACTAIPTPATVSEAVSFASTGGAVSSCPYAASASATNDNDKQICETGIQTLDCNDDIN